MAANTTPAAPARCARPGCGRVLTSPESVRRGFGPVCWRRMQRAALNSRYSSTVQAKAEELIELHAGVHFRGEIWLFPSSTGTDTYRSTPHICTCKAGLLQRRAKNGRRALCAHQRAAEKLARKTTAFGPTRVFAL